MGTRLLIRVCRVVGLLKTVRTNGVTDDGGLNPLSGITMIQGETMEETLKIAKACPHVDIGGTIEIAKAMDMKM